MTEQKPTTKTPEQKDTDDVVKDAKGASLTPDQKHQAYLDDLERIHNEP